MWDFDTINWRRSHTFEHANRYPDAATRLLSLFLHDVCMPDNGTNRKNEKIAIDIDPNGVTIYDDHPPLKFVGTKKEMFDMLTGRDRTRKKIEEPAGSGTFVFPTVRAPHPIWKQIQEVQGNKKCSFLQLSRSVCKCMQEPKTEKCVCKKCYEYEQNCALYHKSRAQWHGRNKCDSPACGCTPPNVKYDNALCELEIYGV